MTDHRPTNLPGSPERVPAVGGTRTVPAPEPIVRDYLLLVLRLDQHRPGLVDAYYGPADLKAQADMESLRPPARLADDAIALRERLAAEIGDARRREFLWSQLVALEAQARVSAGESIAYEELVTRFFDHAMSRVDDAIFQHATAELDRSLPGAGPLNERLAAWEGRLTVEPGRVQVVADHLAARFRARAAVLFGLPDREAARINLVRDRPWGGYNWYEGGRRSRVELNLDLPVRLPGLMHTVAHETYPGHHLEAATKEARLVDEAGWTELTILTINTPECLMHEGLADLGYRFAVPADDEVALLEEAIEIAGLSIAQDPVEMHAITDIQPSIRAARAALRGVGGNAALMRHADGRSHDEVLSYLIEVGAKTAAGAAKQLEFIEDPLWRTYVPVYREGEALLERWLRLVPEPDRPARFARLLAEAHAPSGIETELREAPARA